MAQTTHESKPATKSVPSRAATAVPERLAGFGGLGPLGQAGVFGTTGLLGLQRSVGNQAALHEIDTAPPTAPSSFVAGPALQIPGQSQVSQRTPATAYVGALQMSREATAAAAHTEHPHVQRHSSWEHALLGDAKPATLANIGSWQDLLSQTERVNSKGKVVSHGRTIFGDPKADEAEVTVEGVGKIKKGNVMHDLVQEMSRLKEWQDNPPTRPSGDAFKAVGADATFGVTTVSLPAAERGKSLIITYGELNTLADFYGDLETMKTASPGKRFEIVQSVRKETFLRLKEIYDKIEDSLTNTERKDAEVKEAQKLYKTNKLGKGKFKGAATPDFISGVKGQADLLAGDKPLIGQGTGAKGDTNSYGATLARNACHFVPESWHSWASYHDTAVTTAMQSYALTMEAQGLQIAFDKEDYSRRPIDKQEALNAILIKKRQAADLANEALLNNGFGDHYLQDSYAAGHMINKTQVMQWYIEFIDKNDEWDYFKDKNWRKVQQMAYRQGGLADEGQYDKDRVKGSNPVSIPNAPRNPQLVENIKTDDWKVHFDALGLTVPTSLKTAGSPERKIMEWWQAAAMASSGKRTLKGQALLGSGVLAEDALQAALKNLILDGVVRTSEENTQRGTYMSWGTAAMTKAKFTDFLKTELILREDYVPGDKKKFQDALAKSKGTADKPGDDSDYQRMAAAVTYADYLEFMNSGFIQKSTNALHDFYCKNGLMVSSSAGGELFKVYGDDSMFNAESAKGAKHSGETANMSRDSILGIINDGTDGGKTTQAILARLPSHVKTDVGVESIEAWHNEGALKNLSFTKHFPSMAREAMQKFVPGVLGSELGKITKDEAHGKDAF